MDSMKLSQLPSEYQAVEYIENLDDAWVLIQYIPQQYDEINVTFAFNGDHSHYNCLFSAGNGTRQLICLSYYSDNKHRFYYKYFASGNAKNLYNGINSNEWSTLSIGSDGTAHWNGNNVQSSYEGELDGSDGLNLRIFKRANQTYPFVGKISEFFIQRNGVYQVYLIPCYRKVDNIVGFYDIESNTFYTSSGTSQFVAGGEIQFDNGINNLMQKRNILMMQTDVLPPKYQRVEYLQTHGYKSYFDTGVAGNNNSLQFDIIYTVDNGSTYGIVFGNYDNNRDHNAWFLRDYNGKTTQSFMLNNNNLTAGGSSYISFGSDNIVGKLIKAHIEYGEITFILNNIEYSKTIQGSTAEMSTENIYVGNNPCIHNYGNPHSIYSLKIHKQSKLIRNYIPCYRKFDNKPGFYDLVNHTFNPSIGTVDFIIPS